MMGELTEAFELNCIGQCRLRDFKYMFESDAASRLYRDSKSSSDGRRHRIIHLAKANLFR
jgi:hypothetical protein